MPSYKYKAATLEGDVLENTLVAENETAAMQQLQRMNLIPLDLKKERAQRIHKQSIKKIKTKDVLLFTRQLHTLLRAGIPILGSLNAIKEQTGDPNFKRMIEMIARQVEQGKSFSDALNQFPKNFPPIYINSVKVGEVSGALEETLNYLYKYMKEENNLRQNVKKAFRYPMFVCIGLIGAFIFFTTYVIPQFIPVFASSSTKLPLPTRILLGINYLFSNYGILLVLGIILISVIFYFYRKTPQGKYNVDLFILNIPIWGELIQKVIISRFAKVFHTTNRTGIPVLQSFNIMQDTMENAVYQKELGNVLNRIKRGEGIANSLKHSPYFSPFLIEMIGIGEKSGSLEDMLENVSQFYDEEVSYTIDNMTSLIEPTVIVVLGGMVLLLMLSIFLPIWDMMSVLK